MCVRLMLVLALNIVAIPAILPFYQEKEGVSMRVEDLSHIPFGNQFQIDHGAREQMASIDVQKIVNLYPIAITIENNSASALQLNRWYINREAQEDYSCILTNLDLQKSGLYFPEKIAQSAGFLAGIFGVVAVTEYRQNLLLNRSYRGWFAPTFGAASAICGITALVNAGKYWMRFDKVAKDRIAWIDRYALDKTGLTIEPGKKATTVILLNDYDYKQNDMRIALKPLFGRYISFNVSLDVLKKENGSYNEK